LGGHNAIKDLGNPPHGISGDNHDGLFVERIKPAG
jgi:hypothetical protein